MKRRLKNRELNEILDAMSGDCFSASLNKADFDRSLKAFSFESWFFVDPEQTEMIPDEYNPEDWNEWPETTPPEGVLMRVEVKEPDENLQSPEPRFGKVRERCCAKFDGQFWIRSNGLIVLISAGETVRFRPWVDPD